MIEFLYKGIVVINDPLGQPHVNTTIDASDIIFMSGCALFCQILKSLTDGLHV